MKNTFPILIALNCGIFCQAMQQHHIEDAVDYLQMRKGIGLQVNHSKPLPGQFEEKFDNGQVATSSVCWRPRTRVKKLTEYPNGQSCL